MRVIVVEPKKKPEVREIGDSLESMQKIVGGSIEAIYPSEEPVALICNEEGKLLNLPLNRALRDEEGNIYGILSSNKNIYVNNELIKKAGIVINSTDIIKFLEDNNITYGE